MTEYKLVYFLWLFYIYLLSTFWQSLHIFNYFKCNTLTTIS